MIQLVDYVVGFLFSHGATNVVLIRKERPDWQKSFLNGVGGKMYVGESPQRAISRECKEETGIVVWPSKWKLNLIFNSPRDGVSNCYFLSAFTNQAFKAKTMTDEEIIIAPVKFLQINKKLIPGLNWIIPLCLDQHLKEPLIINNYWRK